MKIIDSRVTLRTEQLLKPWVTEEKAYVKDYIRLYKMRSRLNIMPVDELIGEAALSDIERMVVCGNCQEDNDHILKISKEHREIIPVGYVSVDRGIRFALREVERCYKSGFAAIYVASYTKKLDINDRLQYPVYGFCELMKMPVIVHGSIHFWQGSSMWHGQPQYIDEIAVDFPELKIIVSHGGNGFGPPILAVAQRHPNIFLEFSALNPRYMAPEFLYAANSYLKERCMFGTDYPLVAFDTAINRWKKVLRENVWERFFYQNILDALYREPIRYENA
ncbi:MAG TPA: amidohydrolase family protein [Syntrophorhabdus sp.]|nr:amidohydrolase family protein [Syntrophorhabdus sp.]